MTLKFKKGDTVYVITGKDKGKSGNIEKVIPKTGYIVVTGINVVKKHAKATKKEPHGGVIQKNMAFPASKALILCPRCSKPSRIGYSKLDKNKKIRICKKCHQSVEK